MPAFYPRYTCGSECFSQCCFEIEGLPLAHGVQVLDEVREQTDAETFHTAACLVSGLMLIEAPVRIPGCLANVQPPRLTSPNIVQENDVNRMPCSCLADRDRPQRTGGLYGTRHPLGLSHLLTTRICLARANASGEMAQRRLPTNRGHTG